MRKIAFCFLIYESINHEDLWEAFLSPSRGRHSIYIHSKHEIKSQRFSGRVIPAHVETDYAKLSLVMAQNMLLEEALKDEENKHFVFVSGSCIPLKNFNHVYDSLEEDFSYFNIAPESACFPRCDSLLPHVEKSHIHKASQWCILNRKHARLMVEDRSLEIYEKVYAPDEICYITNMFRFGVDREMRATYNSCDGATTFANWHDMGYKFPSESGPKTYRNIDLDELRHLLGSKALFGRKFHTECSTSLRIAEYLEAIS